MKVKWVFETTRHDTSIPQKAKESGNSGPQASNGLIVNYEVRTVIGIIWR